MTSDNTAEAAKRSEGNPDRATRISRYDIAEQVGSATSRYTEGDRQAVTEAVGSATAVSVKAAVAVLESLRGREGGEAAWMSAPYRRMATYSENEWLLIQAADYVAKTDSETACVILDAINKVLFYVGTEHARRLVSRMKACDQSVIAGELKALSGSSCRARDIESAICKHLARKDGQ